MHPLVICSYQGWDMARLNPKYSYKSKWSLTMNINLFLILHSLFSFIPLTSALKIQVPVGNNNFTFSFINSPGFVFNPSKYYVTGTLVYPYPSNDPCDYM